MIEALLNIWWLWIALALVFGLIELFAPAFIFLGFALGALATGIVVLVATPGSAAALLAIFALLSLIGWVGLRAAFRNQSTGAKVVTKDINDN